MSEAVKLNDVIETKPVKVPKAKEPKAVKALKVKVKAPKSSDPLSPLKTKVTAKALAAVKQLLEEGKGRLKPEDLVALVGSVRSMRHAIWAGRYSGLKLVPLREGKKVVAYVNTLSETTPQTKHIPKDMKSHWKVSVAVRPTTT